MAVFTLIFFVILEWNHPDPIVDLKLLKNRNFGTAVFLQLILGMVLFGSTVLIPQYLQTLLGYTAERAGPKRPSSIRSRWRPIDLGV